MMDPFEDGSLSAETKEVWQALDHVSGTTVSDAFEARLMTRIENLESSPQGFLSQPWLQWLDGFFDFLHVPALAILIALLFWLPMPSPQTAHVIDFPTLGSPRAIQEREVQVFEPKKILQLLIYISRS